MKNGIERIGKVTHHDLGKDGESKQHISGIVGVMKAHGYDPKIKPEAFVASGVANRHSKN